MLQGILLSICIPTYNRANCLSYALESILSQKDIDLSHVEVVISDNASTDNTIDVINDYKGKFINFTYHRNESNLGADRNFLKVIELAHGHYCWYLGSDDALVDDAISKLFNYLGNADVYLVDRQNMSNDMMIVKKIEKMLNANHEQLYNCNIDEERIRYFNDAKNIGSLFSYISSIIIKRDLWMLCDPPAALIGSCWIHVAMIFSMMKKGAVIQYISLPLVLNRTDNDSFFVSVGYTKRRLIDLDYPRVAGYYFSNNSPEYNRLIQILSKQFFTFRIILSDKRSSILADGIDNANRLYEKYKNLFSKEPFYGLKVLLWRIMTYNMLSFIRVIMRSNDYN